MKPFSFFVKFSSFSPPFSSGRAALATSSPLETWRRRRRSRSKLGNTTTWRSRSTLLSKLKTFLVDQFSLYALLLLVAFQYSLNKSSLWTLTTFKKVEELSGIQIAMCPFPSLPHLWCLQICNSLVWLFSTFNLKFLRKAVRPMCASPTLPHMWCLQICIYSHFSTVNFKISL